VTGPRTVRVEPAMGTVVSIDVRGVQPGTAEAALQAFVDELANIERTFSPWIAESEISRISDGRLVPADASPEVRFVLSACDHLRQVSGGAFDVGHAGDGRVDPSGFVKGWAIEEGSHWLDEAGFSDYAINAGGDILVRGDAEPGSGAGWRIGIRDPWDPGRVVRVVAVRGVAVATSGLYERGAHIHDPRTVSAPSSADASGALASLTVIGPSLAWADAYATAGFVMAEAGLEWVGARPGYAALAVRADRRLAWTDPAIFGTSSEFSRTSHRPDVSLGA
jgi:FAD:protein FMN transferase